jgi:hypothetical protein
MKSLSRLIAFTIATCGLVFIEFPASADAADITGTWEVTIHYSPPAGDYQATYALKPEAGRRKGHRDLPRHVRSGRCHRDRQVGQCGSERDGHQRYRVLHSAFLGEGLLGDEDEWHGDGHQQSTKREVERREEEVGDAPTRLSRPLTFRLVAR